jgi:hypothetical protein
MLLRGWTILYLEDMTHILRGWTILYLEDMTHVAESLPGLLLHTSCHYLHGFWYKTNLTRHIQRIVHLKKEKKFV